MRSSRKYTYQKHPPPPPPTEGNRKQTIRDQLNPVSNNKEFFDIFLGVMHLITRQWQYYFSLILMLISSLCLDCTYKIQKKDKRISKFDAIFFLNNVLIEINFTLVNQSANFKFIV